MQLANQKPGKLDTLSQHALEPNNRLERLEMLSQHTQCRHTIPAYTAKSNLYKRGCKSPEQQTSWHSKIVVQLEEPEQEEWQNKQLKKWEARQEAWGIELHQLNWELEDW